jgi:predicted dithiol-disulfide oxidoreductase (DUF899 family)
MSLPQVVSRQDWLAQRRLLLEREKELTCQRDAVSAERRQLPMVRIDKEYVFEGPVGRVSLPDLFEGRTQLIVYHLMWRWDLDAGCPSCSFLVDSIGHLAHLHAARTTLAVVSRGPWPVGEAERVPGPHGLGRALLLLIRQRLQLRLPRHAGLLLCPGR